MKSVCFLLLGALIGTELALGALVAPTIFYQQSILGDGALTQFQSGKLMATIFVKFNYALLAVSVLIALCELASFRSSVKFAAKFSMGMLCAINLAEGGRLKRNVLLYSCFEFSLSSLGKRRRSTLKATDDVLDERSFQNLKDVEPIGRISGMKKWNVIG